MKINLIVFVLILFFTETFATASEPTAHEKKALKKVSKIVIVGDTGMGTGGFDRGFAAVVKKIKTLKPDLFIHLGDYVYKKGKNDSDCDQIKRDLIQSKEGEFIIDNFIFVIGDNDLGKKSQLAKDLKKDELWWGCWDDIVKLDEKFDLIPESQNGAGEYEGINEFENLLIAVRNTNIKGNISTDWLGKKFNPTKNKKETASKNEPWKIIVQHKPVLSAAWEERPITKIGDINKLKPDLVFAGHHHSYQRFCPTKEMPEYGDLMNPDWEAQCQNKNNSNRLSKREDGTIHIVTGGGGAKLRALARQQVTSKNKKPKAEEYTKEYEKSGINQALTNSRIVNHFVLLDLFKDEIHGKVYAVCLKGYRDKSLSSPKDDDKWPDKNKMLECKKDEYKEDKWFLLDSFTITK